MKRRALVVFALLLSLLLTACGTSSNNETGSSEIEAPPIEDNSYLDYTYEEVDIGTLFDELNENPLRAKESYLNHYVIFSGYRGAKYNIKDGAYSEHDFVVVDYKNSEEAVICDFPVESASIEGDNGEKITVWGEIVSVGGDTTFEVVALHYEFAEPLKPEEIVYEEVSVAEMIDTYWNSQSAGEKEYYQKYVSITAPIELIEENRILITRDPQKSSKFRGHISCELKTDEQKHVIAGKNPNEIVTITGRIDSMTTVDTIIGKAVGFSIEIHSLE